MLQGDGTEGTHVDAAIRKSIASHRVAFPKRPRTMLGKATYRAVIDRAFIVLISPDRITTREFAI